MLLKLFIFHEPSILNATPLSGVALSLYTDVYFMVKLHFVFRYLMKEDKYTMAQLRPCLMKLLTLLPNLEGMEHFKKFFSFRLSIISSLYCKMNNNVY